MTVVIYLCAGSALRPAVEGGRGDGGRIVLAGRIVMVGNGIFPFKPVFRQVLCRIVDVGRIGCAAGGRAVAVVGDGVLDGRPLGEQRFVGGGGVGSAALADLRGAARFAVPAAEVIALAGGGGQGHAVQRPLGVELHRAVQLRGQVVDALLIVEFFRAVRGSGPAVEGGPGDVGGIGFAGTIIIVCDGVLAEIAHGGQVLRRIVHHGEVFHHPVVGAVAVEADGVGVGRPGKPEGGLVVDLRHLVKVLGDGHGVRRRGGAAPDQRIFRHFAIGVVLVVPVAAGVAGTGGVGRREACAVVAVKIGVGAAGGVHEFQVEHKQIAVPGEDREIIGSAADGNAPRVFAVVPGEAGAVVQVGFRDPRTLGVAHNDVIVIIHVVAHVAAVGDDGEGTGAGHGARVVGIGDIIGGSAVLDLADQAAVVPAAGDRAPVDAVRHVRVVVGAAALVAGLPGDTAVGAVFVVVIGADGPGVEAAADIGVVIGAAEDAARVVVGVDAAHVPALLDGGLRFVAVAEDTARGVAGGGDSAAIAAVIELMVGVLPVAEDAADGVFARHSAGIIAVIKLLHVVFHVAADAARVVVVAADFTVVFVVAPDARADIAAHDAAGVLFAVNIAAVDVVFDGVFGVGIHHARDTAGCLCPRLDIAGVGAAGDGHLVVVALGTEIAENAARAGVRADLAGVGAVDEGGLVVLDPARDTAGVGIARVDLAGVGAAGGVDAAFGVTHHTGGAVVVSIDHGAVGAVGESKRFIGPILAHKAAHVVVAVDSAAGDMHVFKGQVTLAVADHHGEAVLLIVVVVVDEDVGEGDVFERGVPGGAEEPDPVIAVVHLEVGDRVALSVEGPLEIIVLAVIDVLAAGDIAEIDAVQVDIHVQIDRLAGIGRAGARVVDELGKALGGRDVVV